MVVNTINELITLLNQVDTDATVLAAISNDSATSTANGPAPGLVTTRLGANVKNIQKVIADLEATVTSGIRPDIQDEGSLVLAGPSNINFVGSGVTVTDVSGVATVTIPNSGTIAVQEEGSTVSTSGTLNFVGASVTASDVSGVATITVSGSGTIAVQEEGTTVSTSSTLNFVGANITATDVAGVATITVSGSGSIAVQEEGTTVSTSGTINFVGANITATDVAGVATVTLSGVGNVSKVGTPVNNQIGVWTGDGTIEGDAGLTWDSATTTLGVTGNITVSGTVDGRDIAADGTKLDGIASNAIAGIITQDEGITVLTTDTINFVGSAVTVTNGTTKAIVTITSDVSKVGTPVNNQLGVWTGDGTIKGDANLTYDGTNLSTNGLIVNGNAVTSLADPVFHSVVGWDNTGSSIVHKSAGSGITIGATTVSVDTGVVATLTGTQTLTNKTLTDPKTTHGVNAQTGTAYTLVLADQNKKITMNNAAANTLTVPTNATVAFPVGTMIGITMLGAGTTSVTGATGVTVNGVSAGSATISAQYTGVTLTKLATDTWLMEGNHGTVA